MSATTSAYGLEFEEIDVDVVAGVCGVIAPNTNVPAGALTTVWLAVDQANALADVGINREADQTVLAGAVRGRHGVAGDWMNERIGLACRGDDRELHVHAATSSRSTPWGRRSPASARTLQRPRLPCARRRLCGAGEGRQG